MSDRRAHLDEARSEIQVDDSRLAQLATAVDILTLVLIASTGFLLVSAF